MKVSGHAWVVISLAALSYCSEAHGQAPTHHVRVRVYFVAADEVSWDYTPLGRDEAMGQARGLTQMLLAPTVGLASKQPWKKAVFREYTDAKFATLRTRPAQDSYLGILGPVLRGEVGDTIKVVFKNNASRPYSMHPHGLLYAKDSEGVAYNDDSGQGGEATGGMIPPGETHIYVWQIPERAGPGPNDPSSILWLYHSHVDEMRDIASGLFGPIIVSARGKARDDGSPANVDREFIAIFITINENESWYRTDNQQRFSELNQPASDRESADQNRGLRHSINGYLFGNMPMISMRKGEHVRWYVGTLGDSNNFHTPHWHGNVIVKDGHRMDVLSLLPAQTETVDMLPDDPGIWLFHCHVSDHMAGGMVARYEVRP